MTNQIVLITGALTGIGRAAAFAFAKQGARLVISGRREREGEELLVDLKAFGNPVHFFRADVAIEGDVESLVSSVLSLHGHLDVAVNNAGTEGQLRPIAQDSVENFHRVFDTNVLGTLLCMKYELKAMGSRGRGSVINLSSVAGQVGFAGAAVYTASKHAVEGLTKAAALEYAATGVRVNAVAPGPVATDMLERFTGSDKDAMAGLLASIPAKRAARTEEIVDAILFLAGDNSSFIVGQSLNVDGGYAAQ